jgi:predicted nucleotidyltransferase
MSGIVERVKALGLPLDQLVVIGSGLLDAYGLRESRDVDLVVSKELYEKCRDELGYALHSKHTSNDHLEKDDVEVWLDWGNTLFEAHRDMAVTVDGVMFVNPQFLSAWKRSRGTEKDLKDVELLDEYERRK